MMSLCAPGRSLNMWAVIQNFCDLFASFTSGLPSPIPAASTASNPSPNRWIFHCLVSLRGTSTHAINAGYKRGFVHITQDKPWTEKRAGSWWNSGGLLDRSSFLASFFRAIVLLTVHSQLAPKGKKGTIGDKSFLTYLSLFFSSGNNFEKI